MAAALVRQATITTMQTVGMDVGGAVAPRWRLAKWGVGEPCGGWVGLG